MPFSSKAQIKKLALLVKQGKFPKKKFDQYKKETPDADKLPERIGPKKAKAKKGKPFTPITNKNYKKRSGMPLSPSEMNKMHKQVHG